MAKEEITFYHFYSGMRSFLSKLLSSPIKAKIPDFFKDKNLTKEKLIRKLLDRNIISRKERILDKTNSEFDKPTYSVKYKVKRENFERNMHRLYLYFFENDKEKINECDCVGCMGGSDGGLFSGDMNGGATNCQSSNGAYDTVINKTPIRRSYKKHLVKGNKEKKLNEHKNKTIFITEEQARNLEEFYNTKNNGDIILSEDEAVGATTTSICNGNEVPRKSNKKKGIAGGLVLKTSDGKLDPCYKR